MPKRRNRNTLGGKQGRDLAARVEIAARSLQRGLVTIDEVPVEIKGQVIEAFDNRSKRKGPRRGA